MSSSRETSADALKRQSLAVLTRHIEPNSRKQLATLNKETRSSALAFATDDAYGANIASIHEYIKKSKNITKVVITQTFQFAVKDTQGNTLDRKHNIEILLRPKQISAHTFVNWEIPTFVFEDELIRYFRAPERHIENYLDNRYHFDNKNINILLKSVIGLTKIRKLRDLNIQVYLFKNDDNKEHIDDTMPIFQFFAKMYDIAKPLRTLDHHGIIITSSCIKTVYNARVDNMGIIPSIWRALKDLQYQTYANAIIKCQGIKLAPGNFIDTTDTSAADAEVASAAERSAVRRAAAQTPGHNAAVHQMRHTQAEKAALEAAKAAAVQREELLIKYHNTIHAAKEARRKNKNG